MSTFKTTAMRSLFKQESIMKTLNDRHTLHKLLPMNIQKILKPIRILGKGEFGIAFEVEDEEDGAHYAIKRVVDHPKFKTRELAILKILKCRYLISLIGHFYTPGPNLHSRYLNLVTDLYPNSLQQFEQPYFSRSLSIPTFYAKLFAYQMFAGLAYLHQYKIVHRDICPSNLFVDENKGKLAIGDFGVAKQILEADEKNVSYIVQREYRAPELIYGATHYGPEIDIWAAGVVFAEMLLGRRLFQGNSPIAILHDIVSVLGPPSKEIIKSYGGNLKVNISKKARTSLEKELKDYVDPLGLDLFKQIFQYDRTKRPPASKIIDHHYFDDLFTGASLLPNGERYPVLIRGGTLHFEKLNLEGELDDNESLDNGEMGYGYVNQFKLINAN